MGVAPSVLGVVRKENHVTWVRWTLTWPLAGCVLPLAGCAALSSRSGPPVLEQAVVFEHRTNFATGKNPWVLAVADLNRDGALDLAVVHQTEKSGSVLLGNGDGTSDKRADLPTRDEPWALALADLNGDDSVEVIVGNWLSGSLSVFLNSARPRAVTTTDEE